MIIRKVSLKNIKSYREAEVELPEGITGITGLNGSGKSTVLESIGYVLFDCLPYTQSEFVRNGEKTGEVTVDIEGSDGLRYLVTRKCGSSQAYFLTDSLGNRFEGKDDVEDRLCEILGYRVSGFEGLKSMFENAVGVLQGTFVSEFLGTSTKRKGIFNPLLRVEEYVDAFKNMISLVNLVEDRIRRFDSEILVRETKAERLPELAGEKEGRAARRIQALREQEEKTEEKKSMGAEKDSLGKNEILIRELEQMQAKDLVSIEKYRQNIEAIKRDLVLSEEASAKLKVTEEGCRIYKSMLVKRDEIDKRREKRDRLLEHNALLNTKFEGLKAQIKGCEDRISEIARLKKEVEELTPKVGEQERIEEELRQLISEKKARESELAMIKDRRDRARNGTGKLCPILLNVECSAVSDFSAYFEERITRTESDIKAIQLRERTVRSSLTNLGDPRSTKRAKLVLIEQEARISSDHEKLAAEKARIALEQEQIMMELASFIQIREELEAINKALAQHKDAYEHYQQSIALAGMLKGRKMDFDRAQEELNQAMKKYDDNEAILKEKRKSYDPEKHRSIKSAFDALTIKIASLSTELTMNNERIQAIDIEMAEIKKLTLEAEELKQKRAVELEYLAFIGLSRNIIKNAGQEIVSIFIDLIGREATKMYCEIVGDRRVEIRWTSDYEILMIEDGRERSFQQMSGGEQTSAALAVRLAILKILTNSDVVFLDEPTQNMDEPRRQNLVQEITRIKDFRQMVVISHDDTFNANLENVIEIEKVNGESAIRRPSVAGP